MKRLLLLLVFAPAAHAWDPLSVLNGAVQGQVDQQIRRGVTEAFRSIATPSVGNRPAGVEIREARPGEVVLYTTPTCGYCIQARAYLGQRAIPFLESAELEGWADAALLGKL
jgi:hypothetical protein